MQLPSAFLVGGFHALHPECRQERKGWGLCTEATVLTVHGPQLWGPLGSPCSLHLPGLSEHALVLEA